MLKQGALLAPLGHCPQSPHFSPFRWSSHKTKCSVRIGRSEQRSQHSGKSGVPSGEDRAPDSARESAFEECIQETSVASHPRKDGVVLVTPLRPGTGLQDGLRPPSRLHRQCPDRVLPTSQTVLAQPRPDEASPRAACPTTGALEAHAPARPGPARVLLGEPWRTRARLRISDTYMENKTLLQMAYF